MYQSKRFPIEKKKEEKGDQEMNHCEKEKTPISWLSRELITEAGEDPLQAMAMSKLHWVQLCVATPEELYDALQKGLVNSDSTFCSCCWHVKNLSQGWLKCSKCPLVQYLPDGDPQSLEINDLDLENLSLTACVTPWREAAKAVSLKGRFVKISAKERERFNYEKDIQQPIKNMIERIDLSMRKYIEDKYPFLNE